MSRSRKQTRRLRLAGTWSPAKHNELERLRRNVRGLDRAIRKIGKAADKARHSFAAFTAAFARMDPFAKEPPQ